MSAVLMVGGSAVHRDPLGRYCLNDLHRAAGGNRRFSPNRWTRTDGFQGLVNELTPEMAFAPAVSNRGGAMPGTFVCEELVYSYAMWISPAFHLRVIRAYKAAMGMDIKHGLSLMNQRLALETRDASSKTKGALGGRLLNERRREKVRLDQERTTLDAIQHPELFA